MRVISGTLKGRKLLSPVGEKTRPTTDRVKESIFNIIQFDIEGRYVLDLFAGSGQMGIEALSRGAVSAVFIDNDKRAVEIISENLSSLSLQGTVTFTDAAAFIKSTGEKYDLIFLDPPYDSKLLNKTLSAVMTCDICRGGGIILCETEVGVVLPEAVQPYYRGKTYRYGRTAAVLYHRGG